MLLPEKDDPDVYFLRTDFSNAVRWEEIGHTIGEALGELQMKAQFIEDRSLDGASPDDLLPILEGNPFYSFALIIDRASMESPESPVLVLDLFEEPGRTFRVVPSNVPNVHANLWLANMDFQDFADSVDPDGVFRGFPER
jgi:hypothetical protein